MLNRGVGIDPGKDEMAFLLLAKQKINKSRVVLWDIGFYLGEYTEEFFYFFPDAVSYGFEPNPIKFNESLEKFKDNPRITINNYALYNDNITNLDFYQVLDGQDTPRLSGQSSIHYRDKYYPTFNHKKISIQTKTIDSILDTIEHPDFIKIDTEGSELMVVEGGKKLLTTNPPFAIQWEYGGCFIDSKVKGSDVVKFFSDIGYTTIFYNIYDRNLYIVTPGSFIENYDMTNFLSVHNEFIR